MEVYGKFRVCIERFLIPDRSVGVLPREEKIKKTKWAVNLICLSTFDIL